MAGAGLACLVAIASAPVAVTTLGAKGVALPGLNAAQQIMSLLDARSPGEREKGALAQSKVRRAAQPRERALGKVFPPKPSPVEQLARVIVPTPPGAEVVPILPPAVPPTIAEVISPSGLIASAPFALGPALIGGGGVGGGGIGGGGGGGGGSTPPPVSETPPPTINPVAPAVPEPGTWMMMLLGFGMIGSTIRGRTRTRATAA